MSLVRLFEYNEIYECKLQKVTADSIILKQSDNEYNSKGSGTFWLNNIILLRKPEMRGATANIRDDTVYISNS